MELLFDQKAKKEMRQDYLRDLERIFQLPELIQSEVELEPIVPDLKISPEN